MPKSNSRLSPGNSINVCKQQIHHFDCFPMPCSYTCSIECCVCKSNNGVFFYWRIFSVDPTWSFAFFPCRSPHVFHMYNQPFSLSVIFWDLFKRRLMKNPQLPSWLIFLGPWGTIKCESCYWIFLTDWISPFRNTGAASAHLPLPGVKVLLMQVHDTSRTVLPAESREYFPPLKGNCPGCSMS